jgi:hypothetical protein
MTELANTGSPQTFRTTSRTFLYVVADTVCQVTVLAYPSVGGHKVNDVVVLIPELESRMIGPFPVEFFTDRTTGLSTILLSNPVGVVVGVFELAEAP